MSSSIEERRLAALDCRRPDPDFIERLEEMLADARRGETVGFVGVVLYHEGMVDYSWFDSRKPNWDRAVIADRVVGALDRLRFVLHCERHGIDTEDSFNPK